MESSEASLSDSSPRHPRISPAMPRPSVQNLISQYNSGPISPEQSTRDVGKIIECSVQSTPPTLATSNTQDSPTYLQKDSPLRLDTMPVTGPQEVPIYTPRMSPNESFTESFTDEAQNHSVSKRKASDITSPSPQNRLGNLRYIDEKLVVSALDLMCRWHRHLCVSTTTFVYRTMCISLSLLQKTSLIGFRTCCKGDFKLEWWAFFASCW